MEQGMEMLFALFGGLAMFLYGMDRMSRALRRAAGDAMKRLLARLTATPLLGVLTGLAVTAVLQSSSAATVMVIGFVSAGLLELPRAVAVIYGINIGTTIALCTMPLALSRNKPISPTFIFDKRYRQFFGEFFLTGGLMLAGILAGALFCGFPAIVILISWSLAPMLVLDKGCNASEALTLSNKYTYGNKFLIFILFLALLVSLGVLLGILGFILGAIADALGFIAILLAIILIPATGVGLIAAIYKRLVYQNSSPS